MLNRAQWPLLLTVLVAGLLIGCQRSAPLPADARYYEVKGIVRGLAPDRSSVDVEHEDIPKFMPSMTMTISVHEPKDIADVRTGDAISFRMIVTDKDLWLDQVRKIDAQQVRLPVRTPTPVPVTSGDRLREGDNLPAFTLIDQDGHQISNQTFKGHPLVLTFIFTRCAVPNFCPLMSNNFAQLQKTIQTEGMTNTRLLSITLDPAFDTPQVLTEYGKHLNPDPNLWTFATGDADGLIEAFAVYRKTEGGTLSHGLATALVNGDGKIVKIWRGNGWTPNEVIDAIRKQGDTNPGAN